jgi:hypothetical protein
MQITERDMDRKDFWKLRTIAEGAVDDALGGPAQIDMTDKQAKARSDAIEALTKAMLVLKAVAA